MKIPIYQVDAFSNKVFGGNPAAVCPLNYWLEDDLLQRIAEENNLSETAFFVKNDDSYHLRWFTPQIEIDLCGHATLASAYIIMKIIDPSVSKVIFGTQSGELKVEKSGDLFSMDFPKYIPKECDAPQDLIDAFNIAPQRVYTANYYLLEYRDQDEIIALKPYMKLIKELDRIGVIVTARGRKVDFVSRFFAPAVGIPEDPVTGSAHCALIPFWAEKLKKNELHALQLSRRGGELFLENKENRVAIAGRVAKFLEGTIEI